MLASTCFRNNALLAHAAGEQNLAEHIVDLVCAGVVELIALEIDFRAAKFFCQAFCEIERARATDIMFGEMIKLGLKSRILFGDLIGLFQLKDERHQSLGDKAAAEQAEMPALIGSGAIGILQGRAQRSAPEVGPCLTALRPLNQALPWILGLVER